MFYNFLLTYKHCKLMAALGKVVVITAELSSGRLPPLVIFLKHTIFITKSTVDSLFLIGIHPMQG